MKGLGLRGNLGSKILDPQILKPVPVGPAASITTGLALSLSLSGPQRSWPQGFHPVKRWESLE